MDEALEEILELDGLAETTTTGELPHGFLRLWNRAAAAYDEYVKLTLRYADNGEGLGVRCESGCHGCCHDAPTGVQAIELLAIYHRYRSFPDFDTLHNLACDHTDTLFEEVHKLAPGATQLRSDDRTFQKALLAYRTRARPCVFLDGESGTCRIYEQRPIPCRMHFSLTDPQLCWPGAAEAGKARTPNLPPPESIVETMKRIAAAMGLDDLSPVLFQGLVQVAAEVMDRKPLQEAAPRERLGRRKGRDS